MDIQADQKMTKAKSGLILSQPFFGALLLKMKVIQDPDCETMWVNDTTIGYNPVFVNDIRLAQVKGVLCHEVLHKALNHTTRRGERDHKKWNVACDYAINPIVLDNGMELPDCGLINPAYKDMSAEHIYDMLPDGEGEGEGLGNDPGGCGEVRDADAQSEDEIRKIEETNKIDVQQAANIAKMQGKLGGELSRLVEDLVESKLDWKMMLRRYITKISREKRNYKRPSRRCAQADYILPSRKNKKIGDLAILIDTSGSISKDELAQFSAEVNSVINSVKPDHTYAIYVDTKVCNVEDFTPKQYPIKLAAKGGGGTDFKPGFKHIKEQNLNIAAAIYLTDMYCNSFPDTPDFPVLWISTSDKNEAPFGEVVKLY